MMNISHWEKTNGSPKRTWRYMTNAYDQSEHWWEAKIGDAHIVLRRPDDYKGSADMFQWRIIIYRPNTPTFDSPSSWPLPKVKRSIEAREKKNHAT